MSVTSIGNVGFFSHIGDIPADSQNRLSRKCDLFFPVDSKIYQKMNASGCDSANKMINEIEAVVRFLAKKSILGRVCFFIKNFSYIDLDRTSTLINVHKRAIQRRLNDILLDN
jgi:hypothetical protein